jgi:hypothetical protein
MLLLYEGICSSRSHRCEWKNGLDDSTSIMILFMQVDIKRYDCFRYCMSLDSNCILLWWMCSTDCDYVSLVSSRVLLGMVVYHWIVVMYY